MTISKASIIFGAIGLCLGALGVGYGLGQHKKLNDISSKLDASIKTISSKTPVEISDDIVDAAIEETVSREVSQAVSTSVRKLEKELHSEIKDEVSKAISASYKTIQSSVSSEVAKKVAKIDISQLKREVVEQAKKDAAEKLDGSMDDILEEFNRNLKNIAQVYQSINSTFAPQSKQGVNLTIG